MLLLLSHLALADETTRPGATHHVHLGAGAVLYGGYAEPAYFGSWVSYPRPDLGWGIALDLAFVGVAGPAFEARPLALGQGDDVRAWRRVVWARAVPGVTWGEGNFLPELGLGFGASGGLEIPLWPPSWRGPSLWFGPGAGVVVHNLSAPRRTSAIPQVFARVGVSAGPPR